ncbi:MAG: PAS domain-containing protein [Dehalococcoidia bacterium]|nr:PAS domain-containing protein [Dehalococcoidia bacterium]
MNPDEAGPLFRALVDNSFDVFTVSNRDGILQYVSPSVERVLGYRPEAVVGNSILSFVHGDDVSHVQESFAHAVSTPGVLNPTVLRARHADGSWRVIEAASNNLLADPRCRG